MLAHICFQEIGGTMNSRIHDVSVEISSGMVVYPGDPEVTIKKISKMEDRASENVSRISCCVHTGTHMDAPYHYYQSGTSIDKAEPELLVGPCHVFDMGTAEIITRDILLDLPLDEYPRILFKTANSSLWRSGLREFEENYVYISADAAEYIADSGVKLVGIDYLSIDSFHDEEAPAHKALLGNGVFVIEGLDLDGMPQGKYELICAPLKIRKCDGAPARVFLREL